MTQLLKGKEHLNSLGYTDQTITTNEDGSQVLLGKCNNEGVELLAKLLYTPEGVLYQVLMGEVEADGTETYYGEAELGSEPTQYTVQENSLLRGTKILQAEGCIGITGGEYPSGIYKVTGKKYLPEGVVEIQSLYFTSEGHNYKGVKELVHPDNTKQTEITTLAKPDTDKQVIH